MTAAVAPGERQRRRFRGGGTGGIGRGGMQPEDKGDVNSRGT